MPMPPLCFLSFFLWANRTFCSSARTILVYSWCSKNARKHVHSSSYVINMTACAMIASICFTIPTLWLTMSPKSDKNKFYELQIQTMNTEQTCTSELGFSMKECKSEINTSWRGGEENLIITSLSLNRMLHIIYRTLANFTPCQTHALDSCRTGETSWRSAAVF